MFHAIFSIVWELVNKYGYSCTLNSTIDNVAYLLRNVLICVGGRCLKLSS